MSPTRKIRSEDDPAGPRRNRSIASNIGGVDDESSKFMNDDSTVDTAYLSTQELWREFNERPRSRGEPFLPSVAETSSSIGTTSVERFKPMSDMMGQKNVQILQRSRRKPTKDSTNVIFHKVDVSRRRIKREGSWHVGPHESGYGMMVMRKISAGDLVFSEKPFVSFVEDTAAAVVATRVHATLSKVPPSMIRDAAYFRTLHTLSSKNNGTVPDDFDIIKEYGVRYGANQGVFVKMSSMRHSCSPNTEVNLNSTDGIVSVFANRDILPGEELTLSVLPDLFVNYEMRQLAYKERFPESRGCRCFVCEMNDPEEGLRRKTVLAHIITVAGTTGCDTLSELKAIQNLLQEAESPVTASHRAQQMVHRDITMLRRMHAKASQLSLRCGLHYDGMRHLTISAGYFALSQGWTSPETQRVVQIAEKRDMQACPISNLPIFANQLADLHRWGAPSRDTLTEPSVGSSYSLPTSGQMLTAASRRSPIPSQAADSVNEAHSRGSEGGYSEVSHHQFCQSPPPWEKLDDENVYNHEAILNEQIDDAQSTHSEYYQGSSEPPSMEIDRQGNSLTLTLPNISGRTSHSKAPDPNIPECSDV